MIHTREYIEKRWPGSLAALVEPPICSRGAGEARYLRCNETATLRCSCCPQRRDVCDSHNFGTQAEPLCYECARIQEE